MMRPRPRLPALLLLAALALPGCGGSPAATILTLDAAPPAATVANYRGLPIAVPAVRVPAAIDRTEFVSQVAAGEVRIDDFARWAAPLGLLARDALVRDLTVRLPAGSVLAPGSTGSARARTLDVAILSFAATGDRATMQVAWRALPGGTTRQLLLDAPLSGSTPAASAQAFGTLLGQLADRIATDVAGG